MLVSCLLPPHRLTTTKLMSWLIDSAALRILECWDIVLLWLAPCPELSIVDFLLDTPLFFLARKNRHLQFLAAWILSSPCTSGQVGSELFL
jgi:hypothetical protein